LLSHHNKQDGQDQLHLTERLPDEIFSTAITLNDLDIWYYITIKENYSVPLLQSTAFIQLCNILFAQHDTATPALTDTSK
jgi:hypothetical protein